MKNLIDDSVEFVRTFLQNVCAVFKLVWIICMCYVVFYFVYHNRYNSPHLIRSLSNRSNFWMIPPVSFRNCGSILEFQYISSYLSMNTRSMLYGLSIIVCVPAWGLSDYAVSLISTKYEVIFIVFIWFKLSKL